jgi:hypothetical protein
MQRLFTRLCRRLAGREEGASGSAPNRRFLGLHPFELVTLAMTAATVAFLRLHGLRMDWRTAGYILGPLYKSVPKAFVAGVGVFALYRLARRRPVRAYLRQVATPGWLLLWVRLWLAAMVMTYSYFWLKVCVPLVNGRLWDPQLWRADLLLHLGFSPSVFAVQLLAGTPLVGLLDHWYGAWVATVFYSMSFFAASPDPLFRRRFILSCVLLWTLGAWLYVALPALGPAYVFHQHFRELEGAMPAAEGGQLLLMANYQRMLAGRASGVLTAFNPTRGIAALPSLHVGAHWLFALWARRRFRPLFPLLVLATAFTFAGSLVTGWHYAVDGYVGVLLAWGCYRLARWMERGGNGGEEEATADGVAGDRPSAGPDPASEPPPG